MKKLVAIIGCVFGVFSTANAAIYQIIPKAGATQYSILDAANEIGILGAHLSTTFRSKFGVRKGWMIYAGAGFGYDFASGEDDGVEYEITAMHILLENGFSYNLNSRFSFTFGLLNSFGISGDYKTEFGNDANRQSRTIELERLRWTQFEFGAHVVAVRRFKVGFFSAYGAGHFSVEPDGNLSTTSTDNLSFGFVGTYTL